jgi:hypothetical protein
MTSMSAESATVCEDDFRLAIAWVWGLWRDRYLTLSKAGLFGRARPAEIAAKRVQDRYNLSVPSTLFGDIGLPTVPQNQ